MKISTRQILNQFKDDLIGKDSHRGITLTYAWLANQFGHIALGFIPTFIVYHFSENWSKLSWLPSFLKDYFSQMNEVKAAILISVIWLLFEIYNFLGPLLLKKESRSGAFYIPKKEKYKFKPKWKNVAFDTFTDVCFFALGAFLFSLSIDSKNNPTIIILITLGIYLAFASKYWFVTKMYQFYARFPFQFRLSQWDFSISEENKTKIDNYLNIKDSNGNHLLISGTLSTGKTSLGVGVLNELSIKNNSCLYVPAMKIYNYFFKDEDDVLEDHEIWNWKKADFLLIDDINPSEPIQDKLMDCDLMLSFIDTLNEPNNKNRELIKNKNIIWILGNQLSKNQENEWIGMLNKIKVPNEKINVVNL